MAEIKISVKTLVDHAIDKLKEMDIVPVVRCKDCAVPHNEATGCPMVYGKIVRPDWFCGDGILKDGKQDGKEG